MKGISLQLVGISYVIIGCWTPTPEYVSGLLDLFLIGIGWALILVGALIVLDDCKDLTY